MPNDGLTLWGFFPSRTDALDAVKKLNEWTSAGRTSSSAKQLLKEISEKSFAWAVDLFFFYKLVDELRVNPDMFGWANSIWTRYDCGNFWIPEEKFADSKMSGYGWAAPKRFKDIDSQV